VAVEEHTLELDIGPVIVRTAGGGSEPTPLFLHGMPGASEEFIPFLERCGGVAPDLIGFGRSSKAGNLDFSLAGHADFLEALLDRLQVDSVQLVAHGWGAGGGLVFAQRHPDRVSRLVLINALPLFGAFAWDRIGRLLRLRGVGEIAIGSVTRWYLARLLRRASGSDAAWDDADVARLWEIFDQGTQRAILRLFRDADPERLAEAGAGLGELSMPALVLWGERDPWFGTQFCDAYVARLGDARGERLPDAGHWPWRDAPAVIDRVASFVA
jgi:pimeloyl-ACP methyl ester carboxylesterase